MADRAFPVVFATHVLETAAFYQTLGFERHFQLPPDGEPGYIGLRRGVYEVAVVAADWPSSSTKLPSATESASRCSSTSTTSMQWSSSCAPLARRCCVNLPICLGVKRVAYVRDPDGKPVALAMAQDSR